MNDSKVRADPNAPPPARLYAMGCSAFLGRANEYLCPSAPAPAYETCVLFAKKGQAKVCYLQNSPGVRYPPKP